MEAAGAVLHPWRSSVHVIQNSLATRFGYTKDDALLARNLLGALAFECRQVWSSSHTREHALVYIFRVVQDVVAPSASLSHDPSKCPACPAGGAWLGRKRPYLRGSVSAAVQPLAEAQSTEGTGTRPQAKSQSSGEHEALQRTVSEDTRPQAKALKVEGVAEVTRLQTELKKAEETAAQAQRMAVAEREARLKAAEDKGKGVR